MRKAVSQERIINLDFNFYVLMKGTDCYNSSKEVSYDIKLRYINRVNGFTYEGIGEIEILSNKPYKGLIKLPKAFCEKCGISNKDYVSTVYLPSSHEVLLLAPVKPAC